MKIKKEATHFKDSDMIIKAEVGDFLPSTITVIHNGKEHVYKNENWLKGFGK